MKKRELNQEERRALAYGSLRNSISEKLKGFNQKKDQEKNINRKRA
jgi:hypothetical protein